MPTDVKNNKKKKLSAFMGITKFMLQIKPSQFHEFGIYTFAVCRYA